MTFACGTIEMFGGLYFAADKDNECKICALEGLMCVTPLPAQYYQTPGAQEILRLVLNDALNKEDRVVGELAKRVLDRYKWYDRFDYLIDVKNYKPTKKDQELKIKLIESGKERLKSFCDEEKGWYFHMR
jgi:hypothetical protein